MFGRVKHVHMVGIGGIGMSSIALVLLSRGYAVSGSDLAESETTHTLQDRGAKITIGHSTDNVPTADVVVYSSAVDPTRNVETLRAEQLHIPLIKRSVMLGELMRMKYGIGIAGTHGKTTTTSMTGRVVSEGRFDPTIVVGGKVAEFGSNALVGEGDIIVIEADEYDRTFLRLTPSLAVITNIDADHLDIYQDLDSIKDAFVQFANSVPFFGAAIVCIDNVNVQDIVKRIDRRVVTFGESRQARLRAENIKLEGLQSTFDVIADNATLGTISIRMPGRHNVLNALAAIAVGLELDIDFQAITHALESFSGVSRRFEILADSGDVIIVNDYAHHPVEVSSTLDAASACWPKNRIVAVFQPHLFSRTLDLKEEFARAFFDADRVIITGIYRAREEEIPGVSGQLIADLAEMYGHKDIEYIESLADVEDRLKKIIDAGDRVIFMGAGDIWRTATQIAEKYTSKQNQSG
ncbi:MAG: UDP-N-acetylmuramate--L-alanine ligase [Rhodothermales bacterium]|nr:UDP-N-acetylmuramate--L-alanine ligase [Rhodothermales bacterium]